MKLKDSQAIRGNRPFQPKRVIRFSWISLALVVFCSPLWATDNTEQTDFKNSKQTFKQAEKFTKKGEFPEAEKVLRQLLDIDKNDVKTKLALSYVLLKQRHIAESYTLSFEVAKADSKNARAYALVGMAVLNLGNFKDASTLLDTALALNNKEALAWSGLGLIDYYENRIDSGVEKMRYANFLDPQEPDYLFTLAQFFSRAEKYSEAAEAYNLFLQTSPIADVERRNRIKGLISFLRYLGGQKKLYQVSSDEVQSTVPIEIVRDRPLVEVTVNDKAEKLRFVLDTGSGISVISEETAARLKIKSISKGGMARAVGGDGKFEIVYGFLRSVNVGDVKVTNVPVYIRKFHTGGEKIDGYIGLSLISKFLTTVDYGNLSFTLTKRNPETTANFNKDTFALPLRLTSSGFLSGEVQLHGIEAPLNFIVDTGASISVISRGLSKKDEISQFTTDEKMRVVGAAGVTENVASYLLPKVTFGTHSRESIKAIALDLDVINEASGFEQAGILGGNFLKNYCLTFDFQNSKVTFVPVTKKQ